jgi:hypothetical protein
VSKKDDASIFPRALVSPSPIATPFGITDVKVLDEGLSLNIT